LTPKKAIRQLVKTYSTHPADHVLAQLGNQVQLFAIRNALVVDADSGLKKLLLEIFEPGIWAIQHVTTNRAALRATKIKAFELIITSEKTSGIEDVELLRKIRVERPHVSGSYSASAAVDFAKAVKATDTRSFP
jgi:DNA-binding NtrC family response regulator